MKLLVAVADYPNITGKVTLMYVHTRNVYYAKCGIDVTVLNFASKSDYEYEGIKVISLDTYIKEKKQYDILLCHAANVRNHYRFLKKYQKDFKKIVFFYHGHEVLRINKVYSKPYPFVRKHIISTIFQDMYDTFKLFVWRKYLPKIKDKSHYIFVSNWMKEEFLKWTKIDKSVIEGRSSITYNCVSEIFENETYDVQYPKQYDFITIRNNLDGSKYSIDIVNRLAYTTPQNKFLVVGKGDFFKHYDKAPNIEWLDSTMSHKEIIDVLQKSKFALMPTRTDAQGLMMCEMAAFGIPVITSDIPICHEIFENFDNVYYIDNNNLELSLSSFNNNKCKSHKHTKYYKEKTVKNEVNILNSFNI